MQTAWAQHGLPNDGLSIENAAIVNEAPLWPLLVDPHGQGLKWLLAELADKGVVVTQQGSSNFKEMVRGCGLFPCDISVVYFMLNSLINLNK